MVKINGKLLPIKAHYFFFMAAMGPILPQISVYGKQLGVEPEIMGYITSVLPIIYVMAKPIVGFLIDYFANFRKCIFISLIFLMTLSFAGFYFLPVAINHSIYANEQLNFTLNTNDLRQCDSQLLKTCFALLQSPRQDGLFFISALFILFLALTDYKFIYMKTLLDGV